MAELFTTEQAGVTVTKNVEAEGADVQVGLRVDSSRAEPVAVRVVDAIPQETAVQAVTSDRPYWSTADEIVAYERTLEEEEAVTTGYRYTCDELDAAIHHPPELIVGDDSGQDDGEIATTYDEAAHEDGDEFAMFGDEVTVTEMVAGIASESTTTVTIDGSDVATADSDRQGATGADIPTNNVDEVIDAILEPLDVDVDVTPDQRERVAHKLATFDQSTASLEARVSYLQARFHDLAAYIDAMEEFLDEHGTGEDVLTEVLAELHAIRDEVETVRDDRSSLEARLDDVEGRTERLDASFESRHDALEENQKTIKADQETLEEDYEVLEENHEALEEDHEALTENHEALEEDHETLAENHEALEEGHETLEKNHKTLEEDHQALEAELDRLDETVETRQQAVDNDLEEIEDTLEQLRATQQTIQAEMKELTAFRETVQGAFQRDSIAIDE